MTETNNRHLTRWVAQTLRSQIVSGELVPGDKLPSQKALEERFDVSTVTVRNAVDELEDEGLVARRQGAYTQVHDREPTHRLVVNVLRPESAERIAERPIAFAAFQRRRGVLRRAGTSRRVPATRYMASLLDIGYSEPVVLRSFTVFDGDEPVLTSTSYLPPALASGSIVPDVDVGQLALVGRPVSSLELGLRTRMPDPREFEELAMVKGTPVQVITHRLLVGDDTQGRARAAVEVVSRGDRVFVQIRLDVS